MAQINWRPELNPSGNRAWKGNGPFDDLPDSIWEIREEQLPDFSIPRFFVYASVGIGGDGCHSLASPLDWFTTLERAKAFCQQMHDEAISGSDTGW